MHRQTSLSPCRDCSGTWRVATGALLAAALCSSAAAQDQRADCSAVLGRSELRRAASFHTVLAKLSLVDSTNYENNRRNWGLQYEYLGEAFSGSYENFSLHRNRLFRLHQFNMTQQQSEALVTSHIPAEALQAFVRCQEIQAQSRSGISAWIEGVSDSIVVVAMYYVSPVGQGAAAEVQLVGATGEWPATIPSGTRIARALHRHRGVDFHMVVNAGGTYARVAAPWITPPPPDTMISMAFRRYLTGASRYVYLSPGDTTVVGATLLGNRMRLTLGGYWHGAERCKDVFGLPTDFDNPPPPQSNPPDDGLRAQYSFRELRPDGRFGDADWHTYEGPVEVPLGVVVLVRAANPRPGGGCFHNHPRDFEYGRTPSPTFAYVEIR